MSQHLLTFNTAKRLTTSYARSRLVLGISGVGTAVLIASFALVTGAPGRWLSMSATQSMVSALASIGAVMLFALLAFAVFDLIGGALLVRRRQWAATWIQQWTRGVAVQWVVWMLCAATLLMAARVGGRWAALVAFTLWQLVLAAQRGRLARWVASLPESSTRDVSARDTIVRAAERAGLEPRVITVIDAQDEGFVGGWTGISRRQLFVPLQWARLPEAALVAALARRRIARDSGAHWRGVLGAVLWNVIGLSVVMALTDVALTSAADVVTAALGMTLWSFVGVLLLPTPSRHAVTAIDGAAATDVGPAAVGDAIARLDAWQDDEADRPRLIETIFHPVPARVQRLSRLARGTSPRSVRWFDAHHVARHALWLSWASLTPLSRLVHCNVGRPSLWVMLPGD